MTEADLSGGMDAIAGPRAWSCDHLRHAVDAACVALWSWNVDDNSFTMDELAFDLWGLDWAPVVAFETLSAHIHPADRDRVRAAFIATRSVEGRYEIDFRIIVDGDIRWISARGQGADGGIVERTMFGIFIDVTGRKQAEEGNELLAGEMSHRVKNLLTVAASLTHMTSRSATNMREMANDLVGRLTALGRAHDVVRPLAGGQGKAALLGDLLSILLSPYEDDRAFAGRIRVAVPRMGVGERAAQTLALVIHELATNSLKHGALSTEAGMLDLSNRTDGDDLLLIWAETGGPAIGAAPEMGGFGSKLLARTLSDRLHGSISYDWQADGLVATLRLNRQRLAL